MSAVRAAFLLAAMAGPALPFTLELPAPVRQTARESEPDTRIALPSGPWRDGGVPAREAEGDVVRTAWRLGGQMRTTTQIAAPLRAQLQAGGYRIAYECAAEECGGYDFRFAADTLGAPQMYVDLGDYHYILAERPDGSAPLSLMISHDSDAGYVHLTHMEDAPGTATTIVASSKSGTVRGDLWQALERDGWAPLDDLTFRTGSASLEGGPFGTLEALAGGLGRDPSLRVTLVGHTDADGALGANIALSRRRADAVRQRLIDAHGVDPGKLAAEGVGYLAPRETNATRDGRLANRRVEVILSR